MRDFVEQLGLFGRRKGESAELGAVEASIRGINDSGPKGRAESGESGLARLNDFTGKKIEIDYRNAGRMLRDEVRGGRLARSDTTSETHDKHDDENARECWRSETCEPRLDGSWRTRDCTRYSIGTT